MPNKFGVDYVPEPGPSCMQAGPALRNFAGEHFPLLTSRPCVFALLVVLRFGFRHDGRHAHILALQGFHHHFSGSVRQFFLRLQPAKFYGFAEFSLKCWICWRFATVLYTNCPGRPPETGNTLAITYHVHVPHAHWTSLGLTATTTAVAWTVTEVRAWCQPKS